MAKPKKYEHLRGKVKPFEEDPKFQQIVDELKPQYLDFDIPELARQLADFKAQKDLHKFQAERNNADMVAISQILVELMPMHELKAIDLASGKKCGLQDDVYCKVIDVEKFTAWLKRKKLLSFVRTFNSSRVNMIAKNELIAARPVPPGLDWTLKTYAKITGSGQNGDE